MYVKYSTDWFILLAVIFVQDHRCDKHTPPSNSAATREVRFFLISSKEVISATPQTKNSLFLMSSRWSGSTFIRNSLQSTTLDINRTWYHSIQPAIVLSCITLFIFPRKSSCLQTTSEVQQFFTYVTL